MTRRNNHWLANLARAKGVEIIQSSEPSLGSTKNETPQSTVSIASARILLEQQKQKRKIERVPSKSIKVLQKVSKVNSRLVFEDYTGAIDDFLSIGGDAEVLHCLLDDFWQHDVKTTKTNLFQKSEGISVEDKYLILENNLESTIQVGKHKSNSEWSRTIRIMAQFSRKNCLNKILESAIPQSDVELAKIMLQREADPNSCSQAIRVAVLKNNDQLVRLILRAPISLRDEWRELTLLLSISLPTAHLLQSLLAHGVNVDVQSTLGLQYAIDMQRMYIRLLLLTVESCPTTANLDRLTGYIFRAESTMGKSKRFEFLEVLLNAGAEGDCTAQALVTAIKQEDLDAADLLIKKGALTKYSDSEAFLHAIRNCQLKALASFTSSPLYRITLEHGAKGIPLDDALINAVETNDTKAIKLPLSHSASVDHLSARALCLSINMGQQASVDFLLKHNPSKASLSHAFPHVYTMNRPERYRLMERFLDAGVRGKVVYNALTQMLVGDCADRDYKSLAMLKRYGANRNQQHNGLIRQLVREDEVRSVKILATGACSNQTLCAALASVLEDCSIPVPLRYVRILLNAGARGDRVSEMLAYAVEKSDDELINLLLLSNCPDFNFRQGVIVEKAVLILNDAYLDLLIRYGQLNKQTRETASFTILQLPRQGYHRIEKFYSFLPLINDKNFLTRFLEVEIIWPDSVKADGPSILSTLLNKDAVVHPEILHKIIRMGAYSCLEILLKNKTAQLHTAAVFSQTTNTRASQMLLSSGVSGNAKGMRLVCAIRTRSRNLEWITALMNYGAPVDHDQVAAVVSAAAEQPDENVLHLLVSKSPVPSTLQAAFAGPMNLPQGSLKTNIYKILLRAGVVGDLVHEALLAASEFDTGNFDLKRAFLSFSASVDYKNGAVFSRTIGLGNLSLLTLLLTQGPSGATLEAAFRVFMDVKSIDRQQELCGLLLGAGYRGPQIHEALIRAVHLGSREKVNLNSRSSVSSTTPLILSVRKSRIALARCFVTHGALAGSKDKDGRSALYWASLKPENSLVDALLNAAGPGAIDDGSLHQACLKMNDTMIRKPLAKECNVNKPSILFNGHSALAEFCLHAPIHAQIADLKEIMDMLISYGASIGDRHPDKSLLVLALDNSNAVQTAQALIDSCM
ncbi:hypothetical protein MMC25_006530 [Agyrium rufum]|nr:hypothetical protein [Agyrium rufum]